MEKPIAVAEQIFGEALEVPRAERSAFLDAACRGAPEVRRAVEGLLAENDRLSGFLSASPYQKAEATAAGGRPPASSAGGSQVAGMRLGRYLIVESLGAGGMGVVYRATDTQLQRDVAIKVLPSGLLTDEAAQKRFRKEALALAKLNHPNIASLYDVGALDRVNYLVMELVPGNSLADELRGAALPEKAALAIAIQIVAALEDAHQHNIVHRDLKPANIMVTQKKQVKVLDFGLVRFLRRPDDLTVTESLTQSREIAGTLPYMAPEQLSGEPLDARTDLHALGAVLYEMVTGLRVYSEDSTPRLTDAILHRVPVAPRALNPRLSPELERIILKCLEKEPDNRYQSATEIAVDLRRLSAPSGLTTAREPPAPRSRALLYSSLSLLAAAGLAAAAWFWFHRTPALTEKDSIVVADFTNSTGDPVFDVTLRAGLSAQLSQTPFLSLVSGDQIAEALRLMEKPAGTRLTPDVAREVCRRANATTAVEGSISALGTQYVLDLDAVRCASGESLAKEQVTADGKEKVLAALGDAASRLRRKLGESAASLRSYDVPLDKVTTPSLEALQEWGLANQAILNADADAAAAHLQRAVSLDPSFAVAYSALGQVDNGRGDDELSIQNARRGYELRNRVSDRERFSIETNYDIFVLGNLEKGTLVAEQWAGLFPRDYAALSALFGAYGASGRLDDALAASRKMLQLRRTGDAWYSLTASYVNLGRLHEAHAVMQQAEADHMDPAIFGSQLYALAFLENDQVEMRKLEASSVGNSGVEVLEFYTAAYEGRIVQARELERRAISAARQEGKPGFVPSMEGTFALVEALVGNVAQAKADLHDAGDLSTNPNFDVVGEAAMVAALSGDSAQAQKLADELNQRFPEATVVQFSYLPAVRGLLAARRGNAAEAAEDLDPLTGHERVLPNDWVGPYMTPIYLRGEAHLAMRQPQEAISDFQMLIDNRGLIQNSTVGALAPLGLGRAWALAGDTARARAAYQQFFALWKDADPDVPLLQQAKSEYSRISSLP